MGCKNRGPWAQLINGVYVSGLYFDGPGPYFFLSHWAYSNAWSQ